MRSDQQPRTPGAGLRERNKEAKQARIFEAAAELFAREGYATVTTQQIAERADVAIGTLFRYASTKAELLLMVYNEDFRAHLEQGRRLSTTLRSPARDTVPDVPRWTEPSQRILALVSPLVVAGRHSDANTAAYQREVMFGEPTERYRQEALVLVAELQDAVADILRSARSPRGDTDSANVTEPLSDATSDARGRIAARAISNVLHLELARATLAHVPNATLLTDLAAQISLITRGFCVETPP